MQPGAGGQGPGPQLHTAPSQAQAPIPETGHGTGDWGCVRANVVSRTHLPWVGGALPAG